MIYVWLVFLLALGVQSSQAGCLLKHSDQLEYFFRLDGISSLDEARTLATAKVQLNPAQTICEYIRSELLTQSEYSVRCIQGEPEGGKHWKNCIYEDSFGDIVMDTAKYNFALIDAPNDNDQLQKGYIFAKA